MEVGIGLLTKTGRAAVPSRCGSMWLRVILSLGVAVMRLRCRVGLVGPGGFSLGSVPLG